MIMMKSRYNNDDDRDDDNDDDNDYDNDKVAL